ncbi:MAG TPA: hypothetical protein VHR39_21880 [Propionibacteriaceae bacterium]|jgi:hypothetical protein|nr:hypothetical protein [Propionibacteriaceae bacterium]
MRPIAGTLRLWTLHWAASVAASTRSEVLERLAPYDSVLDLPIARLLADQNATSLRTAAIAAAPGAILQGR